MADNETALCRFDVLLFPKALSKASEYKGRTRDLHFDSCGMCTHAFFDSCERMMYRKILDEFEWGYRKIENSCVRMENFVRYVNLVIKFSLYSHMNVA